MWFQRDSLSLGLGSLGGKAAVVGFLLVSGYSIAASLDRDKSSFYFRRFKRIYPLYFVCVLAAILLGLWLGDYQLPLYVLESSGPIAAVGNLLMLQTFLVKSIAFNGVVWSLAVESSFYVVSPFLKRSPVYLLYALIAVSATFYLLPLNYDGGMIYSIALKANAAKYFWPFAMGFLLYYHRSRALTVALFVLGTGLVWLSDINYERFAIVTFIVSFAILLLARDGAFQKSKFLDYLGDISYPLYLVQIPTFVLCYKMFGITSPALLLLASFGVAAASYELIDVHLKRAIFAKAKSFGELTQLIGRRPSLIAAE